jgi:hypothetical protein
MTECLLKPYKTPTKKDICVVFCFYNPCGYKRPYQNLLLFEQKLRQARIPYFSAELLIGPEQEPLLLNPAFLGRSNSALFYKESLFNKVVSRIPEKYKKIIFTDCDLIWDEPDWVDKIWNELETADICQCFSEVRYLNYNFDVMLRKPCSAKWILETGAYENGKSAPGGAWAMTRATFNFLGGFYEKNVVGGGDVALVCSLAGQIPDASEGRSEIHFSDWKKYVENLKKQCPDLKLSYYYGIIYHLYHGNFGNRFYRERYSLLEGKEWDTEFSLNADGLWELKHQEARDIFLQYFKERREDGFEQVNVKKTIFEGKQITSVGKKVSTGLNCRRAPTPPPFIPGDVTEENRKIVKELQEKILAAKQKEIEERAAEKEKKVQEEVKKKKSILNRFPNLR